MAKGIHVLLYSLFDCLKAKNDQEFEKYLKQLIEDKNLRDRLSLEAKKLAAQKSIGVLSQKVLIEYKKLLS